MLLSSKNLNCREMSPKHAYKMLNSVDPEQANSLAVWSGTILSASAYVSKTLGEY